MSPPIGPSDTRINSIDTASKGSEFDKWLYSPNFRAVKAAAGVQATDNQDRKSFANFLKDAGKQQATQNRSGIVLRPANRSGITDIIA